MFKVGDYVTIIDYSAFQDFFKSNYAKVVEIFPSQKYVRIVSLSCLSDKDAYHTVPSYRIKLVREQYIWKLLYG